MQEWHIDFLSRMDMHCLQATHQGKIVLFSSTKPPQITSSKEDQPSNPAPYEPKPVAPEVSGYASYFPTRILGYLSYEDEPESPQED